MKYDDVTALSTDTNDVTGVVNQDDSTEIFGSNEKSATDMALINIQCKRSICHLEYVDCMT